MKKLLLLVIVLFPFFGFGQTNLVRWNGASSGFAPNVFDTHVSSTGISNEGGVSKSNDGQYNQWFTMGGWPSGGIDTSKYVQFTITANPNYQIVLNDFKFRVRTQGGTANYQVLYSKDPSFLTGVYTLIPSTSITSSFANSPSNSFSNVNPVLPVVGVNTVYVRFYAHNTYNAVQIEHSWGGTAGPTITGTSSEVSSVPQANDDTASTLQNSATTIDVLNNDTYNGLPTTIDFTQLSANGTLSLNASNQVIFTTNDPTYTGSATFKYKLTNANGVSNIATVTVNITAPVLEPLARWSNTDRTATSPSNNAIGGKMEAYGEDITISNVANNNTSQWFQTGGWPTPSTAPTFGALDELKYVEYSITAKPGTRIDLDQFKFYYRAQSGTQSFQVRYSKDDFATYDILQKDTISATSWQPFAKKMTKADPLFPGKTMKVRVYSYKTNNNFNIKRVKDLALPNDFSETAMITGTVSAISSTPIVINDNISMLENAENYEMTILGNDYFNAATGVITITQSPTHGVLALNGQTVLYTPTEGYNGDDNFKYKITDANGVSNEGVVAIKINIPTTSALVRWNNNNYSPTIVNNNVTSANLTVNGGVSLSAVNNNNSSNWFQTGSWPSANSLDTSKYIEFSITAKTGTKINLETFSFNYKFDGAGTYQVRYSKDNFITHTVLQTATTISNSQSNQWYVFTKSLTSVAPLLADEKLTIRVYVYNTNNAFNIRRLKNALTPEDFSETPTISGTLAMQGTLITTWKGATLGWTNGVPTLTKNAIIDYDYTFVEGELLSAKNLTINAGKTVKVLENGTLKVQNNVTVLTAADVPQAKIIVENNGSFVQVNDNATFTGANDSFLMKRETQPVFRLDFTYYSSPIKETSNFTLYNLSPETLASKFYSWNEVNQGWSIKDAANTTMEEGRGYIVRAPQTFDLQGQDGAVAKKDTINFVGLPNNGVITFDNIQGSTTANKWNLIGNPYPSALSIDEFYKNSSNSTNLDGTIYLWTHNTPIQNLSGTGISSYSPSDYASYNRSGGVTTRSAALSEENPGDNVPTGFVAAGQSFFVKGRVDGTSSATFNNAMRVTGNNNQFFKPGPTEPTENWETKGQHRIWLNLTGGTNAFNQALVGYIEGATNALDWGFDGDQFGGNQVTLYSLLDTKKLTIQGRALPFNDQDEVTLGYKTTLTGTLKIAIDHFDGLFEGQDIYLEDKTLNIVHNLKDGDYTFTTVPGTFNERFVLRYVPAEELGIDNPTVDANSIVVFRSGSQINIKSNDQTIEHLTVYDLLGKVIFDKSNINAQSVSTAQLNVSNQVVIVKVITNTQAEVVKKVIMN